MLRSECYKLLGLNENATRHDIRKRYRELAMRYHPDRNPDPDAGKLFIKLTEAADILLGKKAATQETNRRSASKPEVSQEERMKAAKVRFEEQRIRVQQENQRYFDFLTKSRKWKTIQLTAVLGGLITFLLLLDLFLPHHFERDEIVAYRRNVGAAPNGKDVGLVKTEQNHYFFVSQMGYELYSKNRYIAIESSWFFHNPVRIVSLGKVQNKDYNIHFTVYQAWWLISVILLFPIMTTRYKQKNVTFTLLFHMSYYGTSIALTLFLITGDRWAHLLTFGWL